MVAAAIIGGSAITGIATSVGAASARRGVERGAERAASAQERSTQLQVAESRRQFDVQMELLLPLIEAQYGAQAFFADVLGFGGYDRETGTWSGGGPGAMGFGAEGGFFDPNLNPMALGMDDFRDSDAFRYVQDTQLAGRTPEEDLAIKRAAETQFGTNYEDDPRYQRWLEEGDLVGQEFEESPGYQFELEEGQREIDRRFSAGGGNYGGRALKAGLERSQGIANQDYYNWLGQRRQDLDRGDRLTDVSVRDARRREELNVGRGDAALDSYFRRREGDVGRGDTAVRYNTQLRGADRSRQDQGYYNFLSMLQGQASSGAVQAGVGASAREGAAVGGAYGNEGNYLSRIWENLGNSQANISMGEAAGWNNALQGGLRNWMYAGATDQLPEWAGG